MTENINIYIRWGLVNFAAQGFLEIIPGTCNYFMPATLLRGLVNFSAQGFYCWDL
jgi:hypothetical protein